jgi:hypothetical protein
MATLTPFYGQGTTTGTKVTIYDKADVIGFTDVGSGEFVAFAPYSAQFQGHVAVKGDIGSLVTLTDADPSATSGPCSVEINGGSDGDATYAVDGQKLVITYDIGGKDTYTLWQDGTDTYVDSEGHELKFRQ